MCVCAMMAFLGKIHWPPAKIAQGNRLYLQGRRSKAVNYMANNYRQLSIVANSRVANSDGLSTRTLNGKNRRVLVPNQAFTAGGTGAASLRNVVQETLIT